MLRDMKRDHKKMVKKPWNVHMLALYCRQVSFVSSPRLCAGLVLAMGLGLDLVGERTVFFALDTDWQIRTTAQAGREKRNGKESTPQLFANGR